MTNSTIFISTCQYVFWGAFKGARKLYFTSESIYKLLINKGLEH